MVARVALGEKPMHGLPQKVPGFHARHVALSIPVTCLPGKTHVFRFDLLRVSRRYSQSILKLRGFEIAHAYGLDSALVIEFSMAFQDLSHRPEGL